MHTHSTPLSLCMFLELALSQLLPSVLCIPLCLLHKIFCKRLKQPELLKSKQHLQQVHLTSSTRAAHAFNMCTTQPLTRAAHTFNMCTTQSSTRAAHTLWKARHTLFNTCTTQSLTRAAHTFNMCTTQSLTRAAHTFNMCTTQSSTRAAHTLWKAWHTPLQPHTCAHSLSLASRSWEKWRGQIVHIPYNPALRFSPDRPAPAMHTHTQVTCICFVCVCVCVRVCVLLTLRIIACMR